MHSIADLDVSGLSRRFGAAKAVDNVSFNVSPGRFFSILGPSGCGKTTLLRILAGFERADHGDILIRGLRMNDVPPNRRPVNLVFQHLALFPTMSVGDNIAYGLKRRGVPAGERRKRIQDILERVGLPDFANRPVSALSGGQKQRVALARCLVLEPQLLLLDEPLGALDLKLREQMKVELKRLQQAFGTTFVYITHDQSEALVMSDQIAVMRQGRFEQIGTPQALYHHPQTPFVAGFVGDNNRLTGTLLAVDAYAARVQLSNGCPLHGRWLGQNSTLGQTVQLYLRPENCTLQRIRPTDTPSPHTLMARVQRVLFDGANSRAELDWQGVSLFVRIPQTLDFADLQSGEPVHVHYSAEQVLIFPADGAGS